MNKLPKKMTIDPICQCGKCGQRWCWQDDKDKDKDFYKVTMEMLKNIKCPECGSKDAQLTVKEMD